LIAVAAYVLTTSNAQSTASGVIFGAGSAAAFMTLYVTVSAFINTVRHT
jgi:hypothetical protein